MVSQSSLRLFSKILISNRPFSTPKTSPKKPKTTSYCVLTPQNYVVKLFFTFLKRKLNYTKPESTWQLSATNTTSTKLRQLVVKSRKIWIMKDSSLIWVMARWLALNKAVSCKFKAMRTIFKKLSRRRQWTWPSALKVWLMSTTIKSNFSKKRVKKQKKSFHEWFSSFKFEGRFLYYIIIKMFNRAAR